MANTEKNILVIGNSNEFLVRSVINDLAWRDFTVSECGPSYTEVSRADPAVRLYVIIISNYAEVQELLIYLKEVSYDKKLYICVICNHDDSAEITKVLTNEELAALYIRPVNIKEVGLAMEGIYEKSCTERRRKAILIIDDDPTFLRKTQQLLKDSYKIYMANSAASALMILSKHTVDLILLDYDMPMEILRTENEAAQLLPFSRIQELFGSYIGKTTFVQKGEPMTLHVHTVRLTMQRCPIENNAAEFYLLPAWEFLASVDSGNASADASLKNVVVLRINALDGSIMR